MNNPHYVTDVIFFYASLTPFRLKYVLVPLWARIQGPSHVDIRAKTFLTSPARVILVYDSLDGAFS